MLLFPVLAAVFAILSPQDETPTPPRALTLEQVSRRGESVRLKTSLPSWRWDKTDRMYLVMPGSGDWMDPRTGKTRPAPAKDDDAKAKEKVDGKSRRNKKASSKSLRDGIDGDPELVTPSADGKTVSFVRDNDLYLFTDGDSDADGGERRITFNGGPDTFNGILDWVYQEEIYGRNNFRGHWWSPDSRHVAFLSLDESSVQDFTVIDHIETGHFRVKPEITRYPKPGDPNPHVTLGVVDLETDVISWVDLAEYTEAEPLIVRVGWLPDGSRMWFCVQDRIQTWADFLVWDPATGKSERWIHEESESWTTRPAEPRWLADGGFLWESHRTGYNHIYHYDANGQLIGAITSGDWRMRRVVAVDEEAGLLWFDATKDGAIDRNLYRIKLDGTGFKRLTEGRGSHRVTFNADRSFFTDSVSSISTLPQLRLCTGEGEIVKLLAESQVTTEYLLSSWELVSIPTRDGISLDGMVLRPVPFDPERPYPVWISTYSGPNAPTVRNRWNSSAWSQFLAQNGVVSLQVNVRSASGRGHDWTATTYKQLGVEELRDLEDAVDWLTHEAWADSGRVGITGHSYGGFMAGFALTHSDRFALGIAGSGVFDWGMYDTIYTERYMSTPQANPEGYKASSVIAAAKDLKGHLLITHGVMDDNVHVQNTMQLIYALQKADRPFDLMLYPQNRHGIADRDQSWHLRQLTWKTIQEHLLQPAGS